MPNRNFFVTDSDYGKLERLIKMTISASDRGKRDLYNLKAKLEQATIVGSREISDTLITMNSIVQLIDLENGHEYTWRLVYPKDENIKKNRISILAPVGIALLGHVEGDTFELEVPLGKRKFRIEKITYQPEAAGNFSL